MTLIKCPGHVSLSDVEHFNTPFTCDNFGQTRVQHREGKTHHYPKNLLQYHVIGLTQSQKKP
jgi:uncharacterized pyridoxal phosphate-containing UPF0001 family protein